MAGHLEKPESLDSLRSPFAWLTWEIVLYAAILSLALALRLGFLETRIMDVPEAHQAWQAWRLAHGESPSGSYSPLLLTGQTLLFTLFGASDATARLLPALVGSALVLLPYLLRWSVGRVGALAASLALAVSPSLVYSARYGDGASLLLFSALGLVALWQVYSKTRHLVYVYGMSALTAFFLLSDPRMLGVLAVLAGAWAIEWFLLGRAPLVLDARGQAPGQEPVPWRQVGLTFGATLVVSATAFAYNPGGLGAWADYASAWVQHLIPVVNGHSWTYPLLALVLYEPFLLLFGLIGALGLFAGRANGATGQSTTVYVWLATGFLLLAVFSGGHNAGDVALVCAPLAILAGRAINRLVSSWQIDVALGEWRLAAEAEGAGQQDGKPFFRGRWVRDGVLVLIVLLIVAYVGLQASFYARAVYLNRQQSEQFLWFWLLAVALLVLLGGFSLAWLGGRITWRAVGTVLAFASILASFSAAVGLNYRRANDPRELHILVASDQGTRDVLEVMSDFSYNMRGGPRSVSVVAEESLGPVWPWYLRDWEDVTFVGELTPDMLAPLILSSAERADPAQSEGWSPLERYIGQDFVTRTWWQPSELVSNDPLSWWLYRKSITRPVPVQRVVLWVQAPEEDE